MSLACCRDHIFPGIHPRATLSGSSEQMNCSAEHSAEADSLHPGHVHVHVCLCVSGGGDQGRCGLVAKLIFKLAVQVWPVCPGPLVSTLGKEGDGIGVFVPGLPPSVALPLAARHSQARRAYGRVLSSPWRGPCPVFPKVGLGGGMPSNRRGKSWVTFLG